MKKKLDDTLKCRDCKKAFRDCKCPSVKHRRGWKPPKKEPPKKAPEKKPE